MIQTIKKLDNNDFKGLQRQFSSNAIMILYKCNNKQSTKPFTVDKSYTIIPLHTS